MAIGVKSAAEEARNEEWPDKRARRKKGATSTREATAFHCAHWGGKHAHSRVDVTASHESFHPATDHPCCSTVVSSDRRVATIAGWGESGRAFNYEIDEGRGDPSTRPEDVLSVLNDISFFTHSPTFHYA